MPSSKLKEILVLHHSHLDVGYTHSQPVLWEMQREYLDQALDFLDQTADFPEPSLPRWTCEVTEPLVRWLETATPAQVERFAGHLASGRIGISAMQYNTTPLCSAEQLARQLYPARALRERFGAKIQTLNQHDVDGLPWPMVELMLDSGVELLIMAINLHLGGAPSPRPGIFRWQGSSGREILVMNGNHYTMFDQILYAWDDSLERMAEGLAEYEPVLEQIGYPYDFLYLTTTNSPAAWDNSPPNLATAQLIRRWNEAGRQPQIRYVTPVMLLERIRQLPPEQIPLARGDWTDYWNFGSASTAAETRLNQNAKAALYAAELIEASQAPAPRSNALEAVSRRAWGANNQYDEHTWGYFNTDPDHPQMQTQAHLKRTLAYEARELADYLLVDQLERLAGNPLQSGKPDGVLLVNPSGIARSEVVPIPESWTWPGKHLRANRFQYEAVHPSRPGMMHGPVELPPFSWKIVPLSDLQPAPPDARLQTGDGWIETPDYRLTYSTRSGRVLSLFDKQRGWEVLDQASEFSLFEFVRERTDALVDPRREAYYDRDLEREKFNLSCWHSDWRAVRERAIRPLGWRVEAGPASARLCLSFEAPGVSALQQSITLHAGSALIDLDVSFNKQDYRDPEGIYFALPLNLAAGWECLFDTAGAPVRLDADQIPGACRDWFTAGSFAALYGPERGVTLYCPDAPMLQAGGFNFGRKQDAIPRGANPLLLAWPMNNYWNTNFPLTQPGAVRFHYALQTHGPHSAAEITRQAQAVQAGVLVHPVCRAAGQAAFQASEGRLLELQGEGVVLQHVKLREDGRGAPEQPERQRSAGSVQTGRLPAGVGNTLYSSGRRPRTAGSQRRRGAAHAPALCRRDPLALSSLSSRLKGDDMSAKRILVTGATGKVGRVFIQRLLAQPACAEFSVRALCHNRLLEAGERLEVLRGSIEHRDLVEQALDGVSHVVHLATCKETPDQIMDVAVKGLFWLLETCRVSPTFEQFILIGGDAGVGHCVYPHPIPVTETQKHTAYPGCYALSKVLEEVMLEQYYIQYNLNGCCLRAPWIMEKDDFKYTLSFGEDVFGGPRWRELVGAEQAEACRRSGAVPVMLDPSGKPVKRNFVHVDDLVSAMLLALDHPGARQQTFNISMDEPVDYGEMAAYLAESRGLPSVMVPTGYFSTWLDNTKAKLLLGWRPEVDLRRLIDLSWDYQRPADDPRVVWYPG